MSRIIIALRGGCVLGVASTDKELEVDIVDFDNIDCGEGDDEDKRLAEEYEGAGMEDSPFTYVL